MVECPICKESLSDKNVCNTKCGHTYCMNCIIKHSNNDKRCPLCRKEVFEINHSQEEKNANDFEIDGMFSMNNNIQTILLLSIMLFQYIILYKFMTLIYYIVS